LKQVAVRPSLRAETVRTTKLRTTKLHTGEVGDRQQHQELAFVFASFLAFLKR
jgi:hypothetical protein